jgi:hypothetical protein
MKTIRVFISSTFRDMHAERDHLARFVFPELRSRCQRQGAEFVGLDLRWGVTEEDAARQGALSICLDEIERCRPFFVCILGERYGWVPPPEAIPVETYELAAKQAASESALLRWYRRDETTSPAVYRLRRDRPMDAGTVEALASFWEARGVMLAGRSITACEILSAAFDDDHPSTHGLFYMRKPGIESDERLPAWSRSLLVESEPRRREQLRQLKDRIRGQDRFTVREYDTR